MRVLPLIVAFVLVASESAWAQASTPPPQSAATGTPTGQEAEMTTATFGDWVLQCRNAPAGQPAGRSCEVVQNLMIQGQAAPFAQLGFGRLAPEQPLYFTAVVPTNVTLGDALRIAVDENDTEPVALVWTRCLPGGCFASLPLPDSVLKRWRARTETGWLTFQNGAGEQLTLPMSFRGLARALDALDKKRMPAGRR